MKLNEGDLVYYKPFHIEIKKEKGIIKKVHKNSYQFRTVCYEILILSSGLIKMAKEEELEEREHE